MDVWLDSGVSWHAVLESQGLPLPSDMYVTCMSRIWSPKEANQQHTGTLKAPISTADGFSLLLLLLWR